MADRLAGLGYAVLLPDPYYRTPFVPFDVATVFTVPEERQRLNVLSRTGSGSENTSKPHEQSAATSRALSNVNITAGSSSRCDGFTSTTTNDLLTWCSSARGNAQIGTETTNGVGSIHT